MATHTNIENLKQHYKHIIAAKIYKPNTGKIAYDWRKAEESILKSLQKLIPSECLTQAIGKAVKLQQLYENKHFPPFYSYYSLQAFLKSHQHFALSVDEEMSKLEQGSSEYQQIAIPLLLQQGLFDTICKKQTEGQINSQQLNELAQMHVLSILKINQWELKMSAVLNYPVFFLWDQASYILSLNPSETFEEQQNHRNHRYIHNILRSKYVRQDDLLQECEKIMRKQKARELQLILNLPFFAQLKTQQNNSKIKEQPISKSSTIRINRSLAKSVYNNGKHGLESLKSDQLECLKSDQLEVLRKFKSLKTIKIIDRAMSSNRKTTQQKGPVKYQIQLKLSTLKQKIKANDSSLRTRQQKIEQKPPLEKKIKVLMENQIDLNEKPKLKQSIDFLQIKSNTKITKLGSESKKQTHDQSRILKLQVAARELASQKILKSNQIQQRNKHLQALKLQLIMKVKEKTNNSSNKTLQQSFHQKQRLLSKPKYQANQNSSQVGQLNKKMLQTLKQTQKSPKLARQQDKLAIVVEQKQKTNRKLLEKSEKVSRLQQKLQQLRSSAPRQVKHDDFSSMVIKKQMQLQIQKQKISQVSKKLEQRVKVEQLKYQQLRRNQQQQQIEIKKRMEDEVQVMREKLQSQAKLQQQRIKHEEMKKQQFQLRIAREKQEGQALVKQVEEWQLKQKQLQLLIEQQKQKQKLKHQEQLAEQKKKWQQQLLLIQQKETQLIKEYRSSNQNLISMLQLLKQKNCQIEAKLKQQQALP